MKKPTALAKKTQLPKQIFVRWEGEAGDQYLDATESIAGISDGERVGIYELFGVRRQKVTEELVDDIKSATGRKEGTGG